MQSTSLLLPETVELILKEAESMLGKPYLNKSFNCVHFVVEVCKKIGIPPPLMEENLQLPLTSNDIGSVILLDKKTKPSKSRKRFTHCGIVHTDGLIHCSYYFGKCVSITPWDKVFDFYQLATLNLSDPAL